MRLPFLTTVLAILTVPLFAEQTDRSGWQYDAVMPDHLSDTASPTAADINAINDVLAKMLRCWNAHDLDGYLSVFWNSPGLMVVINDDQYHGWDALRDAYKQIFSGPNKSSQVNPTRTQIRINKPDLALAETAWTFSYQNSDNQVLGSTSLSIQKINGAWKVISSYSRFQSSASRGWEYDSITPDRSTNESTAERDDIKAVNDVLLKLLDRWNAHDIDGMMSVYWHSPQLLVVVQEEQVQGWNALYSQYKTGYPDPNAMGSMAPSRIQIRFVGPDLAIAQTWWMVTYPTSKVRVVGNTTTDLQRFADGWKIVMAHSSIAEP